MDDFSQLISKETKRKIGSIKKYINEITYNKKLKKIKRNIKKKIKLPKGRNKNEIKDINKNNKSEISNNQKLVKKRNAGVDLLRIITMIGIVYTHVLHQGNGLNKYNKYRNKINNSYTYFFWHDNAFALISGVVGYKSTKYSNLLYLWLCVVFYSVGIHYYYLKYKKVSNIDTVIYKEYFPVIYGKYWYFTSYFGMFLFLPAVNKGIQYLNKPEFKALVMSICGIFVIWQSYMNSKDDHFKMNDGVSTLWLLCLYIIGGYIGKFNVVYTGIKRYIFSFIYLFIFLFFCFIHNKYIHYTILEYSGNYKKKLIKFIKRLLSDKLNKLSCVVKTAQSISLALFFLQLEYNKYLSKLITFIGPLTFAVYLIHLNSNVSNNYLKNILNGESYDLKANEVIQMFILKSVKIFSGCIIIDYLRHLLFTILKIRKICILAEKIFFKIIS